ncbi:MAG: hypothetical protein IPG53_16355 [Ignavibacteriales bacterium]|nr:hypothetical protein [Ignavibacteriales bacterium]
MKRLILFLFVINSMLFSQWEEVKIFPVKGDIVNFHLKDSLNITAVIRAETSKVIKSTNGGRDWSVVNPGLPGSVRDAIFLDENNIFICNFSSASISKSNDGGLTWVSVTVPSRFERLDCLNFLDNNLGFALVYDSDFLDQKRLIKTTNGGATWTVMDSSFNNGTSFYSVQTMRFINSQKGWLFSDKIYQTTDGGASFTILPKPPEMASIRSIDILNDTLMVIGGFRTYSVPPYYQYLSPQVAYSSNSGQTWIFKDLAGWTNSRILDITFIDPETVVGVCSEGMGVIYTTNAGTTWGYGEGRIRDFEISSVEIKDGKVYAGGQDGSFFSSDTDFTQPWNHISDYSIAQFRDVYFRDPGFVLIATDNQKILISSDRGNSWVTRRLDAGVPYSVSIAADSVIYAATYLGLYRSTDMGMTFDSIGISPPFGPMSIEVWPNNDFWITTSGGIYFRSYDSQDWELRSPRIGINYPGNIFNDGTIYFVGTGKFYKSTDFGITWSTPLNSTTLYNHADFYDKMNGIVTGQNGLVLRTRDGGATFEQIVIPGANSYSSRVYFFDSLNIFINSSELFSSYDGGWSWKINEFSAPNFQPVLLWLHFFDFFEGIAVSDFNGLAKTHNRGNTPVELSAFSAIPLGNKVTLQWTTETETNNMGFEIERRDKYGDWKKIAFSKGSGTSTHKIYYGYDDYEPKAPAILYYRLKQIDYNGEFEYSNEVEVLLGEIPENYSIQQNYPNPFNPSTKLTFSLPEENKVVIKVFNAMGEQVREIDRGILSHGYFEQDFEMGTESSGMYFCQVLCTNTISGRTKSLTVKMVLMK